MTEEEKIEELPEPVKTTAKFIYKIKPEDLPQEPKKNTWYTYRPEGCICADGSPYYSTLKVGTENKLMVMFIGGGCAFDEYAAPRPNSFTPTDKPTFYNPTTFMMGYFFGHNGMGNKDIAKNPFKDWSVVVISYANGDFHCGTSDFNYDDKELGKGVCYHRGYTNYRAMMDKIKELVPSPEQIMVTGYSAGGFGAALLTDDIIGIYDKCDNFICFPDSSVLESKRAHEVAQNQWGAPKAICDRIKNNITLDCLLDLHKKHGDKVKIMFGCTYRDALLAQAQNYLDGRGLIFDKEGGDRFQQLLKEFIITLKKEIPNIPVYIFDRPNAEVKVGGLTDHTFIAVDTVFDYSYGNVKIIDWISDSISGKNYDIGLELLGI